MKAQVEREDDLLEKHVGEIFKPKSQSEGIKLALIVRSIHGRNVHGNVTLVVDALQDLHFRWSQDQRLQLQQVIQNGVELAKSSEVSRAARRPWGPEGPYWRPAEDGCDVLVAQGILLVEQLVKLD